jgi:hypothetical protein
LKNLIWTVLISMVSILAQIELASATPNDTYNAKLILYSRGKAGLIAGSSNAINGQILVTRNNIEVLRFPVVAKERSLGLTLGFIANRSHFVDVIDIAGVSPETKIADFLEPFEGVSLGGATPIPGPCCLTIGANKISAKNNHGLSFRAKLKIVGLIVDYSKFKLQLEPAQAYTDRKPSENQNLYLSQLASLPYSREIDDLINLECKEDEGGTYHYITVNKFHEFEHSKVSSNPLKWFTAKTYSLKPSFRGTNIYFIPEKIDNTLFGDKFTIDLVYERKVKKDFFERDLEYRGSVQNSTPADSNIKSDARLMTCISKNSLKESASVIEGFSRSVWIK